jgi:hypothetical protein
VPPLAESLDRQTQQAAPDQKQHHCGQHAPLSFKSILKHGEITGGVGAYKGVTGTLVGTSAGHNNENVTATYHR